jgi:phosphoribosylformimino-5-aminoimidazole carboxamide ribotide isomerase
MKRIQELRDTGARRVVVGTMHTLHPEWFREAAKVFPEGLLANIDEKDGRVLVKGRTQDSGKTVEEVLDQIDPLGIEGIVITSVNGTSHERILKWSKGRRTPVMLHAQFQTVAELLEFRLAGVRAAILGREIYDRTIDFDAASKYFKTI